MFEECRSGSPRVKETHKWILKSFPERGCLEGRDRVLRVRAGGCHRRRHSGRPQDLVRLTRDGPVARASLTAGRGRKDSELPAGWEGCREAGRFLHPAPKQPGSVHPAGTARARSAAHVRRG